jgi:hypothetical protein
MSKLTNKISTCSDIYKFENKLAPIFWKKLASSMEVIVIDDRENEDPKEIAQEIENRKEADTLRLGFDPNDTEMILKQFEKGNISEISFELEPWIFNKDSKVSAAVPYLRAHVSAFQSEEQELGHFLVEKTRG